MADVRVVDHHREVARHLELVAAADADAVDARERRLADLAQPVVRVLEGAEPLPVALRVAEVLRRPLLEVGADAERAPGAGDHDDADLVVPGRVLARARQLAQHPEVEGVEPLGTVERDRRARRRLLVDDPLEAELGRSRVGRAPLGSVTAAAPYSTASGTISKRSTSTRPRSVIFSFGITESARKDSVRNGVATVQPSAAAASLQARL